MPEEQAERCRMQILSEEYADLIVSVDRFEREAVLDQACMTRVSENRAVLQLSQITLDSRFLFLSTDTQALWPYG